MVELERFFFSREVDYEQTEKGFFEGAMSKNKIRKIHV